MIKRLDHDNFNDFKAYCIEHKGEHDESFLYDEDFDEFEIGYDNPTYLLYGEQGIEGVCSIIQEAYYLNGNKARVRIFHCKNNRLEDYKRLLEKILPLDSRAQRIVMFIPSSNIISRKIVEEMGFFIERYSYVMERCDKEPKEYSFPDGFSLTDFVANRDEEDYLNVRNKAFETIIGSETPITKEQVTDSMKEEKILIGGGKILRYKGRAVGVIRMELENEEGKDYSFVAPLAILPEYQGKGLGSNLLRAGIKVGCENVYNDCMLTVNAENENALKLYINEGFEKTMEVVCYNLLV